MTLDGDNDKGDWSDGGGFSRNPKLSLLKLKPSFNQVAVPVGNGVKSVNVVLNYRQGLSIGPVALAGMARVALLSNPRSTGNRSLLPRVRAFAPSIATSSIMRWSMSIRSARR
jgi:hypothetical protein